ncbi:MAG TPA: Ig domain-containing protein [Dongiaceae bacterium]|nr:Ig domain-containing protein [Dongiaceae bacterium]
MAISSIHNQRGIALFNIVFVLIFIGVLVASGVKMYGSMVARGKINDSKGGLDNQVKMIVAWAVKNGRLPIANEYPGVFGGTAPLDAWGKSIYYIYDANLAAVNSGGLCGRTTTSLSNNAFALVSGGDDFTILSATELGVINISKAATAFTPDKSDLYRIVSLDELKSKAGCYGPTGGRLRVVNNELPSVCSGSSTYPAVLFADGGVTGYTWVLVAPPSWLTLNSSTGVLSPNPSITGTAGTYPVTVTLTDSHPNTVLRTFNLIVKSCGPAPPGSPGNPIVFKTPDPTAVADNWNGGTANDQGTNNTNAPSGKFNMTVTNGTLNTLSINNGTTSSCIWYQRPLTLTGKKMRAYFQFVYNTGDGFVLVMAPALGRTTTSSCDENAYMGFGSGIPGNTLLGAEFQVNDHNQGDGPGSTCIAATGTLCTAAAPGINNWTTGGTYYVRAELDTTATSNLKYNVWMTPDSSYQSAFKNLSTAYSDPLPLPVTKTTTLTSANLSDLNNFFLGFTTGQHGNNNVNMVVSGLKFVLY